MLMNANEGKIESLKIFGNRLESVENIKSRIDRPFCLVRFELSVAHTLHLLSGLYFWGAFFHQNSLSFLNESGVCGRGIELILFC